MKLLITIKSIVSIIFNFFKAGAFYNDKGAHIRFANLFEDIAKNIPQEKVEQMKDIIQSEQQILSNC